MKKENIILIGMPSSGKTTYGKFLAKKLNLKFVDADVYIKNQEKRSAQNIIDTLGEKEYLKIEEERILELLPLENCVFAPGGSIIYSEKLMNIFSNSSFIIFLNQPFEIIEKRLTDKDRRGIVGLKTKPLEQLYDERCILYRKYANAAIDCFKKSDDKIIDEIIEKIKNF